jgi:uncharacterized membrane protein
VDRWFEILLKYPRVYFEEGALGFRPILSHWLMVLLAVLLVGVVLVRIGSSPVYRKGWERAVSGALRILALMLLCVPLIQPILIVPDTIPEENFLAVLLDDSQSMEIADASESRSRGTEALDLISGTSDGHLAELSPHFQIRFYTFGGQARRVDSLQPAFGADETNIAAALRRVSDDFRGLPLSAVVLLSDGADNSVDDPMDSAMELRARDVPVYAIGFGQDRLAGDREILDVSVNDGVEETTGAEISVKVRSEAEENNLIRYDLLKGGEVVFTTTKPAKGEGKVDQFSLFFEPEDTGAAEYLLRMEPAGSESNTQNNEIRLLIDSRRDTMSVLYFEGQPRTEFKFIKRALEDDPAIEFVSVTRTGSDKLYRQGVSGPDELAGGFPADQSEMNSFHAILFGDIEAAFFTPEQLQMVERFVARRGGGFLMGGGLNAFADGDYWNTPIADVLPVEIDPTRRQVLARAGIADTDDTWAFSPTAAGFEMPILKLSADPAENRSLWNQMARLNSINLLGAPKPGAVVLAERVGQNDLSSEPVLLVHRFGRGRAAALATASTWRWQMLSDNEDTSHERFWRQMVRWLVASTPGPVNIEMPRSHYRPGESLRFSATVYDEDYLGVPDASVEANIYGPNGVHVGVTLQPDLADTGRYLGDVDLSQEGIHEIVVRAKNADGSTLGSETGNILVRPSREEFRGAGLRRDVLQGLAAVTGGQYFEPDETFGLVDRIRSRRTSRSVYEARPLWDMPLLYLIVLALLLAEWSFRRLRGMP